MKTCFFILTCIALSTQLSDVHIQKVTSKNLSIKSSISTTMLDAITTYDSLEVKFWDGNVAKLYKFHYYNGNLNVYCTENEFKIVINNREQVNHFIRLIESFYITNSNEIILNKQQSDYISASNFSTIEVLSIKNGKIMVDKITQLGSEKYKIEYNPEFLKLFELLKELSKFCDD